jgi:hypothetical protein
MPDDKTTFISIGDVTSDLFHERVDSPFSLAAGEYTLPVTLVDCKECPDAAGPDSTRTPFSILFRADLVESHAMQQAVEFHCDIHGLEHGVIAGLIINRTLRPPKMSEGAYYHVVFG